MSRKDLPSPATVGEMYLAEILDELRAIRRELGPQEINVLGEETHIKEPAKKGNSK